MRSAARVRSWPAGVRLAVAVAAAVAVGVVLHAVAQTPGVWGTPLNYLRETAAPYLLVPFLVGGLARARLGAALFGIVACWLLVAAYYGWFLLGSSFALHGSGAERVFWLAAGAVSGALMGVLGRVAVDVRAVRILPPVVLILEPVAWFVLLGLQVAPVLAPPQNVIAASVEVMIGVVWMVVVVLRGRRTAGRARRSPAAASATDRAALPQA